MFGVFLKSFKDNFKQATIINLIMIAVGAVLYLDLNVAKNMPGSAGQIFSCDLYGICDHILCTVF